MKTKHPWLVKYPIRKGSKYLIIGTHPPMPYCGKLQYYYGNMSEFWRFLDMVYPGNKLYPNKCPEKKDVLNFINSNHIAITDIIYITRAAKFSTDEKMGKISKEDLNPSLAKWLKGNKIEVIYFTSFGGSNSAKNLFKKWYKEVYKKTCKLSNEHENIIDINGNSTKVIDLFSPSPSGRRGLAKSKEFLCWSKKNNKKNDFDGFRLYWYKKYLPKIYK
jgi:G:T/U-mismatch repair DNA glycosylase